MKKLFTSILLSAYLFSFAQTTKKTAQVRFRSINQIGFVNGQTGTELLLQSINGIQYQTFIVGIGIGLDYYQQRSVPVFLELRKNLFKKTNTPFVYVDGGHHFVWLAEEPEEWFTSSIKGELYYDLGVGYHFPAFRSSAVTVSLGYNVKTMSEIRNIHPERSSWPPPPGDFQKFDYKLSRYSFKMGLAL